MKKKKTVKIVVVFLVCILIVSAICIFTVPKLRTTLFVHLYHELIEDGLTAGNGVPADDAVFLGYDAVNTWDGNHPMTEFVVMSKGDTHYGCYYSPDDIPLAFQNIDTELTQDGHAYWKWSAEERQGATSKIIDYWYFFEVSQGSVSN